MVKAAEIFEKLNKFAPVSMKMDFDNVGFLVGHMAAETKKILVSLDITDEVVEEAVKCGADLIVAHHPMFFSLKAVNDSELAGRKILRLAENGIAAICMHTNLDAAAGGVNDALAEAAGIKKPELLTVEGYNESGEAYCIGRCGYIEEPTELEDYLTFIKKRLSCGGIRYASAGKKVSRVAVLGGSGGGELHLALEKGCDTYVTADVKYHQFIEAKELGINIIDAGHFCTENVVVPVLAKKIKRDFPQLDVLISSVHRQVEKFF